MEQMDVSLCPVCEKDETYTEYSDLERGIECRKCENCNVDYMVHYKLIPYVKYIGSRERMRHK